MGETTQAVERAGFHTVRITLMAAGSIELVQVTGTQNAPTSENYNDIVAQIVWRMLPVRFNQLNMFVIPPEGPGEAGWAGYDRATLEERFGPRPPGLDDKPIAPPAG